MPTLPKDCPGPENCGPVAVARGWHLKRELQLGHIISTLVIALSAAAYISKMDQRLAVLEAGIAEALKHQRQRDELQDLAASRTDAQIRHQLTTIDGKLDRLIERGSFGRIR